MEATHKYKFAEWVKIQESQYGQIIDYYGNGMYTVDVHGMWDSYHESEIAPDDRPLCA